MSYVVSDIGFDHVKQMVDELSLMGDNEFLALMAALYPDSSKSDKSAEEIAKEQRKKTQEVADKISRYLAGDAKAELIVHFKDLPVSAELLIKQMMGDIQAFAELMPQLSPEFRETCGLQLDSYLRQCRDEQQKLANRRSDPNQSASGFASQTVLDKTGSVPQAQLKPNLTQQLQNTMRNGLTNPQAAVALMAKLQQTNQNINPQTQSPQARKLLQRMAATLALANIGPPTAINSPATQQALTNNPAALAQKMRNPAFVSLMQQGLDRNNPAMAEQNNQLNPNAAYKAQSPLTMTPYKQ